QDRVRVGHEPQVRGGIRVQGDLGAPLVQAAGEPGQVAALLLDVPDGVLQGVGDPAQEVGDHDGVVQTPGEPPDDDREAPAHRRQQAPAGGEGRSLGHVGISYNCPIEKGTILRIMGETSNMNSPGPAGGGRDFKRSIGSARPSMLSSAPMEGSVIEFRDVRKVHAQGRRDVVALDGVSLSIGRREFVTIMGPSGSGKSTLLHLAGGLDIPTSGEVLVAGKVTSSMDDTTLTLLRRREIGFVFQFFNLIPSLNIVQNASLPALLAGKPAGEVRARAEERLKTLGLGERMDHFPEELSGGEMQRVAIVRALITDPPIVLADEPTGNLDTAT